MNWQTKLLLSNFILLTILLRPTTTHAATYTDDFNRSNGTSLGANWTESEQASKTMEILSNQMRLWSEDNTGLGQTLSGYSYYTTQPIADQYSQMVYKTKSGTLARSGVIIRGSTDIYTSFDGYFAMWDDNDNSLRLYQATNHDLSNSGTSGLSELGTAHTWSPTSGDVLRLEAYDDQISVLLDTGSGFSTVIGPVTDSTHTSGNVGFASKGISTSSVDQYVEWDDWEAGDPDFEVAAYRWFANNNGVDVGSPLAAQDTSATVTTIGGEFRLRLLIHVSNMTAGTDTQDFKLQVSERSGSCDTSFSGETYSDISPSSGIIRYYNNSTPADNDNLTDNVNDPSHSGHTVRNQDYEEANNFTNTIEAIPEGEDGLWDFSLDDYAAEGNKYYCFRPLKVSSDQLETYTVIPEIFIDPGLTFTIAAVSASTVNNAITTSAASTYNTLPFGNITAGTPKYIAHALTVTTNASNGYDVTMKMLFEMQGTYPANNLDPFAPSIGGFGWGQPAGWTQPTGSTPNTNTGWIGANTTDTRVPGWSSSPSEKFGPVNDTANQVMYSTTAEHDGTTVYVTYGVEVNVFQPADLYSGTILYNILPSY